MKDDAGGCGFYWSAKYIESRQVMLDWIEDVLLQIDNAEFHFNRILRAIFNFHFSIFN